MFCGKCGKEIEDDALTCKYCGASTEEVLDDQPTIGLDEMIAHQEARKASEKKEEFQAKVQPEGQKVPLSKTQTGSAAQAGVQNGQQLNQQPNGQNGPQPGIQGDFQARPNMGGQKAFQAGPQMGGPNGPAAGTGTVCAAAADASGSTGSHAEGSSWSFHWNPGSGFILDRADQ